MSAARCSVPRTGKIAAAALLALSGIGAACACTSLELPPLNHESEHPTYPSFPNQRISYTTIIPKIRGCTVGAEDLGMVIRVEFPGLTPAGTIYFDGQNHPAYEAGPDSPLMIFRWSQANPFYPPGVPLALGVPTPVRSSAASNMLFNLHVGFFTRPDDHRLRTMDISGGSVHVDVGAYPALGGSSALHLRLVFPAPTCPLDDAVEALQDVQAAELNAPGSTAREKVIAIRMNCGTDAPRATMTLTDAGDAANTGSLLTPTADSDAGGVRVQLLRNGAAVQFGQPWNFDPGIGGVHDHTFTARYYRTSDALIPGSVKGEAVLNADYR
ncbi:fimbrial protein [Stenotrophomonas sepilia]